jgi:hypothetical protein
VLTNLQQRWLPSLPPGCVGVSMGVHAAITCFGAAGLGLSPHVRQRTFGRAPEEQSGDRSEGKPITRGDQAMTMFRSRSADAAELFALEHRFPFTTTLIAVFLAGNVGSAVLMLLAQS